MKDKDNMDKSAISAPFLLGTQYTSMDYHPNNLLRIFLCLMANPSWGVWGGEYFKWVH